MHRILKRICTLELRSVSDMMGRILVAPLKSFRKVPFHCLLSQSLQSLFLSSVHRLKTCELTRIYRGRFGSSSIFFLTWTGRCKSMLRRSFQERVSMCMCLGSRHGVSMIILFVRCDRNCLALFYNIHDLRVFNWFSFVTPPQSLQHSCSSFLPLCPYSCPECHQLLPVL